jgi:Tfp pilus assembly protein PilF
VAANEPTWTGEVELVMAERCMACHHQGGVAPFSLATYAAARRHADAVRDAVREHRMPPWLPVAAPGWFAGDRRLSPREIRLIVDWAAAGAPRGERTVTDSAVAVAPWHNEWQLGPPDLVVEAPEPFTQPAHSQDVFRNLIFPVPLGSARFVRAIEFSPGPGRAVHHAIIQLDRERASRALAGTDGQPGFGGMDMGASEPPDGHLLAWTPGKLPAVEAESLAWVLPPESDLIVQMHLPPTDTARSVRPRIGLYFTPIPPARPLAVVLLKAAHIDIPAGDSAYPVGDTLTLPVPVRALSIYPHAHFLARQMRVTAEFPSGSVDTLLRIDNWNFFWQDQYRFASPLDLPAGTRLIMRYMYDNSASNPRNPSRPPRRVMHGNGSHDEMASLSLQVDLAPGNRVALEEAMAQHALDREPGSVDALYSLGTVRLKQGRLPDAIRIYRELLARWPDHLQAQLNLGAALAMSGAPDEAAAVFRRLVTQTPHSARAWYNLGRALYDARDPGEAVPALRQAVALDTTAVTLRKALGVALVAIGELGQARAEYQAVLRQVPDDPFAKEALARLRGASR